MECCNCFFINKCLSIHLALLPAATAWVCQIRFLSTGFSFRTGKMLLNLPTSLLQQDLGMLCTVTASSCGLPRHSYSISLPRNTNHCFYISVLSWASCLSLLPVFLLSYDKHLSTWCTYMTLISCNSHRKSVKAYCTSSKNPF